MPKRSARFLRFSSSVSSAGVGLSVSVVVVVATGAEFKGARGGGAAGFDSGLADAGLDFWGVGTVIAGCSAFQSTLVKIISTNGSFVFLQGRTLLAGRVGRLEDTALHKHRGRLC